MKVLFFAPRDFRTPDTGGKLRNFHVCRELARDFQVTTLCFADGEPREEVGAHVVTVPHQPRKSPLDLARGLFGRWPLTVLNYTTPEMREALTRLLREETFDVVQIESLVLSAYLPMLREAKSRPKLICDWHNVDSEVLRRYATHAPDAARKLYARVTARKLYALERRALSWFDAHLTVSDRDREHLLRLRPQARVTTVENGADTSQFDSQLDASPTRRHRIVFVGSMDYHANEDAALWFAREVWPQLSRARPDWTFTVVGRNPSPPVRALAEQPNIEVTGTVADVRPFYAQAIAAVVPLRVGGGSRLKIVEAMAARVPIVSTRLGAEGLRVRDNETCLLRDAPDEMCRALLELAQDDALRQKIIEAARELAARYDWSVIGATLREVYAPFLSRAEGVPEVPVEVAPSLARQGART